MLTREPRAVALLALAAFTAVVLAVALLRVLDTGDALASSIAASAAPAAPPSGEEVRVVIPEGASPAEIVDVLAGAGVASDIEAFRALVLLTDSSSQLLAGEYRFREKTPPLEVLRRLRSGPDRIERITFRPGLRVEEVGETLHREEIFPLEEWEAALADAQPRPFIEGESFLGYLMPGTYEIEEETTAASLLEAMLDRFEEEVTPALIEEAEAQGWSLYEVLTLASAVEREAANVEEKPLVASVFRNRLNDGMPLQADPTVQFALTRGEDGATSVEQHGWWKAGLTVEDLEVDSPYNTYLYPGLFPGPIANPDIDSIRAVVDPAETDFHYFVVAPECDGTHVFASTLEEHSENVDAFLDSTCGQTAQ